MCTVPRLNKKSVPKAGASLTFANDVVWLLKGNNDVEFWKYIPAIEKAKVHSPQTIVNNQDLATHYSLLTTSLEVSPNPLNDYATIHYNVPIAGKVSIRLYNATGELISTLLDEYKSAGFYSLEFGNWSLDIPQGVYFIKFENGTEKSEVKLIVQ